MNILHKFFRYFKNNKPILFNFKTKEEYYIRKKYLKTLIDYSKTSHEPTNKEDIINDFINTDVLTTLDNKEDPFLNYYAHIFHNITKDTSVSMSNSTEEEWASAYIDVCERVKEIELPKRESIEKYNKVYKLPKPDNFNDNFYDL